MKFKKFLFSFLVIFLLSLVGFLVFLLIKATTGIADTDFMELDSMYISSEADQLLLQTELEEELDLDNEINPLKVGELELDENRKILSLSKDLTQEEKQRYEEEYNIEFTNDRSVKGTYSIIINEESDIEGLQELDTLETLETDIPVKLFYETIDWGVRRIGADLVWDYSTGSGVTVAVIDTGVQLDHLDLSSNVLINGYDFVNNNNNASDDNGHGTHVAGIIASGLNGFGSVGTSHKARIMPIKVLNESGYGYLSDVAKGIYFAADNGARIINLSLGTTVNSDTLRRAVEYAANKGVLLVGAAGNNSGSPCTYPAAYNQVICVVATDQNNKLASFSNIGGELAAPGVGNYSTYINSTYTRLSGTSMAAPHVAGSAAVLMSLCNTCTTSEIRNTLRDNAIDLGAEGFDIIFGHGLVSLSDAVEAILPEIEEEGEEIEEIVQEEEIKEPEVEVEDTPVTSPSPDRTTPRQPRRPSIQYSLEITSPATGNNRRYTLRSHKEIEVAFRVLPSAEEVSHYEIYLNNEKVRDYNGTDTKFIIDSKDLTTAQHRLSIRAVLNDNTTISDSITLDLVRLTVRGRPAIRGVSDFRLWFLSLLDFL